MAFDPYLHFQGACAEAMAFYAAVFGGEVFLMRYREAPDATPEMAASERVMHAALRVRGRVLMASDYPPGMAGEPQASVSISHLEPTEAQGRAVFDQLSEGGEEIMGWSQTFWADGFGMVKDRFGTHWLVSGPEKEPMAGGSNEQL